jgi:phosphohistidine swiveling domain-containing protein
LDDRSWHYVIRTRLADLMKQTGQVLTEGGLLDKPTDILLLTPGDLAESSQTDHVRDNREMYLARKREYEGYRRLSPPLFLGKPPDALPEEAKSENASQLAAAVRVFQGQGYSPGQVTGISRKVTALNDPAFLDLLTNEQILVCPKLYEWRPDWLSLFTVIRGLVTVRGVQLQHATQIARECGIPFVNLPEEDWDAIPDNTPLSLDGKAGIVTVLE